MRNRSSSRLLLGLSGLGLLSSLSLVALAAPAAPPIRKPKSTAKAAVPAKSAGKATSKPAAPKPAPPKGASPISYEKEVKPILVARCYACHGNGTRLGGFQIDSREGILTGSETTHPVVQPGKGAQSYLVRLVSGQVAGKIMPPKGARLTPREVGVLRAWIDQGLSFGNAKSANAWKPSLALEAPRVPAAPPGSGLTSPIDLLLSPYFRAHKVQPVGVVDDRTYARRVYLDLIGLLPTPEELRDFEADRRPDKRALLARTLLADDRRYAEHWLSFWNDLLRNDYIGTGYIDGGRASITGWLYDALLTNKPYDRFVSELVNPTPASAGFTKGIVWRGVVNASQTPQMQAAQSISQVFMGINLKCASCHDSFINTWKLADAYGMAGIYADKPLEMVRCDKPTGQIAPIKFLYPELGAIDPAAPRDKRTEQLASILLSRGNGRLPRTVVNRLWQRLMGRGMVEPVDEMDHRPWSPELLDWLAADLVKNGYDLKKTLERIVTSRAYQLPPMTLVAEETEGFVFRGPVVKRMSAEQFVDAVSSLTGVWSVPAPGAPVKLPDLDELAAGGQAAVKFRSEVLKTGSVEVDVDVAGARVLTLIALDGGNGASSDWANWVEPKLVGMRGETSLTALKWHSATTGYGQARLNRSVVNKPLRLGSRSYKTGIGTHANSYITYILPPGTTRFRATAGPDTGAYETPGAQTSLQFLVVNSDRPLLEARAALATADPLTRALGRPNREQIVTWRSPVATTLQALELTNGQVLASMLAQGAEDWMSGRAPDDAKRTPLVDAIYERALGRRPSAAERSAALDVLGTPPTKEGVEDLFWALVMLPEFQLIY